MKDFTRQPKVIEFKIDDDVFRAKPRLPAQTMIDFTLHVEEMGDNPTGSQGFKTMMNALEMVLLPEHFKKFRNRMRDPNADGDESADDILDRVRQVVLASVSAGSVTVSVSTLSEALEPRHVSAAVDPSSPPIELTQVNDVIEYVMEEYGMRPPQPHSDSSAGQPSLESGTNSTGSSPAEASTS